MRFKDKVVLVTGASRGIGRATALLFAKEGAHVIINYIKSHNEAKKVVEEIKKLGNDAISIECNVSKEDQVKKMMSEIKKKYQKIDVLVNNAGIVFDVDFQDRTVEQWTETLGVNLIGTFLCSKYAHDLMKNSKGASIVNVSSTNGINSFSPNAMDYDASKAGVIILTRNLAKQLAPNIRVNSVAPGWVDTDMNKDLPKDFIKQETDKIYLKRWAQPEEIGKVILFLASEDARYITGGIIKVDGGYG